MTLSNKDEYLIKEVLSRVFRAFTSLVNHNDPQIEEVMNKCQTVLLEVIQKELTAEEQFHYIQSCKHTLEMSEERYNELNKKIYTTLVDELSEMIWNKAKISLKSIPPTGGSPPTGGNLKNKKLLTPMLIGKETYAWILYA